MVNNGTNMITALKILKIMHNNDMGLEKVKNTYSTILTIINNYRQCITI